MMPHLLMAWGMCFVASGADVEIEPAEERRAAAEALGSAEWFARTEDWATTRALAAECVAALRRQGEPKTFADALTLGKALALAGEGEAAAAEFFRASTLTKDPKQKAEARFRYGLLFVGLGVPEDAVAAFEEAAQLNPQDPRPGIEQARLLLPPIMPLPTDGVVAAEAVPAGAGAPPATPIAKATEAISAAQKKRATDLLAAAAAAKEQPFAGYAQHQAAIILYQAGDTQAALGWVDRLTQMGSTHAQANFDSGVILRHAGRLEDALKCFAKALGTESAAGPDAALGLEFAAGRYADAEAFRRARLMQRAVWRQLRKPGEPPKISGGVNSAIAERKRLGMSLATLRPVGRFVTSGKEVFVFSGGAPVASRAPRFVYAVRPAGKQDGWGKPEGRYELIPTLEKGARGQPVFALEGLFLPNGHQTHARVVGVPTEATVRAMVTRLLAGKAAQ